MSGRSPLALQLNVNQLRGEPFHVIRETTCVQQPKLTLEFKSSPTCNRAQLVLTHVFNQPSSGELMSSEELLTLTTRLLLAASITKKTLRGNAD